MSETDAAEAKLLGKALKVLRERANMTQLDAAKAMGLTTSPGWGKYELGKAKQMFSPGLHRKLVKALGATMDDLVQVRAQLESGAIEPATGQRDDPPDTRSIDLGASNGLVPLYGMAAAQNNRIVIAAGSELRWVPMHPAQRGYRRVGAVEVVGESMFPRWKPREIAYFVFGLDPRRGGADDVIIELLDGTAMIKEYIGRTAENLMLREYFPKERAFDLPLEQVKAVHAVVR
jgi:transcriptional regulator with XRE-family HTH domain